MPPVRADRLVLLDRVEWFILERPVLVRPGETYWVDRKSDELCVDRGDGRITRTPGWVCR
ncbi:hypothetical protein FHX75_1751 [Micromonospora palomenae]|uniref:Uncharacterized protein n=1 Tax=Micromonospora palomenae TaxID=1461247 RepID=A0A561VD40_9ACTN|nr:hypothetical protein [Micromonospora palomenae]TWG09532.1 hypothetical protein FHX75_1751 [Micromonospora palomenae]